MFAASVSRKVHEIWFKIKKHKLNSPSTVNSKELRNMHKSKRLGKHQSALKHMLRPNLISNPSHTENAYAKSQGMEGVAERSKRERKMRARKQEGKAAQKVTTCGDLQL